MVKATILVNTNWLIHHCMTFHFNEIYKRVITELFMSIMAHSFYFEFWVVC